MSSPTPVYDVGDSRFFEAQFVNADGVEQDPSDVMAEVFRPDGQVDAFTYPDAALSRLNTGLYQLVVEFEIPGRHQIRFIGSGDVVSGEMVEVFIRGKF
ncbi:hypothetical protein [Methylophaga lonarensis]|uniref:hypothetical protein n=1 Tax=Methylophaga lonarensis TaxID=999151 RepID=UPI003D285D0E